MSSFYERVLYEIREREKFYEGKILIGTLTHDEYKTFTGRLYGLMEGEEAVKTAYKAMFENKVKVQE